MPCAKSLLILGCAAVLGFPAGAQDPAESRLLFTGDVLLSRQVRREIEQKGQSPWAGFAALFKGADWVMGNLEGAVGRSADCLPGGEASPCFDTPPDLIPLLAKAGFRAMGTANNHARDLGTAGVSATRQALRAADLDAVSFESSPYFASVGGHTVAVIAVSTVPARDGTRTEIPGIEIRQKLRLARNFSELVIVSIHWGSELLDWPDSRQREMAAWLVRNGAGLVIGHHPHVVQAPECVGGRPVFYSLGNHLFDQKYPATKQGLIADCRIRSGTLRCTGIATETPPGTAFPRLAAANFDASTLGGCPVPLAPLPAAGGVTLRGRTVETGDLAGEDTLEGWRDGARVWRSAPLRLLSAEWGKLGGKPEYVFTLERHPSPIDNEDGVRPYVYEIGPRGLVARWRGSALAWPLLDAEWMPGTEGVLCALHRDDSFVALQPTSNGVRTAVYRWNGFGFSGVSNPATLSQCRALFATDH